MIEKDLAVQFRFSPGGSFSIMVTVVAGVIERGDEILIAQRRATGQHPLKWEFPGGKVEAGETPEAALERELAEELGIQARVDGEISRYEFAYAGRAPILLIFYRVREFSGEPKNLDFEQMVWARRERLGEYDFLEGDEAFINSYSAA